MLKLLKSFFRGSETPGRYPEALVRRALNRAIEGTDPRLGLVRGCQKTLHAPVIHAIDHIISLVDGFPEPTETSAQSYGNSPILRTMFSSSARMLEVLGTDINLNRFLRENTLTSGKIWALLLAEYASRDVFGSEIRGNIIRRDVAQRVVSFSEHRLVGLAVNSGQARSEMGSAAYNHLLALALESISDAQEARQSLDRQRTLLKRKLHILNRGGWSFDKPRQGTTLESGSVEAELEEIEMKLKALGTSDQTLTRNLDIVCRLLDSAEDHLWKEELALNLDRMNIEREAEDTSARQLTYQVLRNSRDRQLVILPVLIPLQLLPKTGDFLSKAKKYISV
jgi:hypothetical protein